jgi:hypothetical protein
MRPTGGFRDNEKRISTLMSAREMADTMDQLSTA